MIATGMIDRGSTVVKHSAMFILKRMEVASIPQGHCRQAMADNCGGNRSEDLNRKQVSWL
jgi:cytidine deaminase